MILFVFLQIQQVVMEITKCEIVHGHPDILYPTNSNQFVESLDNYFHGEGLTYILNTTVTQFGVSQSISVSNKTQTAFPGTLHVNLENTIFIDDAAQYNWTNPNYQTGQFAALVEVDQIYYVYETSFSSKTQTWTRMTMGFSNTATVLCTNVEYIFENDFLVSCLSRPEGFQLFYYFQRVAYKIFTKYIPGILIRVDTTIFLLNNVEFSSLQVLNDKSKSIYVSVAHANYFNENTVVQVFSVEVQRSRKEPLKFWHHYVRQHDRAIYGAYLASAYEIYLLFYDVLVLHNTRNLPNFKDGYAVTEAQGMGVFKETYTDENYNVFITIVTKKGLVFFSTSHLQSNQQPALPKDFDTNKRLRIRVSAAYSVVSDGTTLVVYANRYDYKENLNQYGFLYSRKFTNKITIFIFDTLGSNFNVYDNILIFTYQILIPYIYSKATLNQNYGVQQSLLIYAMAQNGKNCSVNLTYELIETSMTLSFVAQSNKREREEPYLLFNSQSKLINIGDELIGANLQYAAELTQILPPESDNVTDIIEPQQPTATLLTTNLIELTEPFVVQYSYTYQVDEETYLLFTQLTNSLNFLRIQRCKFIACMETIQVQHGLANQQIISISAFKSDLILHVVIGSQSDILSIDFQYSNLNRREEMNHIQLNSTTGVPTIQLTSLQFINEALLVLTNTPNAIICYNTLLREQYRLTGNEISPRAIFINNFIYNDTYFVDNQYELVVIQHTKNLEFKEFTEVKYNYNVLTAFNYPNNYKQQQISVGLIKTGFYLIQITAQKTNVYFYPYTFLYYYIIDSSKFSFSVQVVPITSMGVTISQPFVTGVSGQDYFYVSVVQNGTRQQQVVVLRPSPYEFDQLYQIIDIQQKPTSFNLVTVNRAVSKFRNDDLKFQYDVLIIQSSNTLTVMQVFKEAMMLFTPNIQFNNVDTFGVDITATAGEQAKLISRSFKVTKQALGIIERSSEVNEKQQALGSIFYLNVNPADFFYGYVSNYTFLDKIGLRLDLQDVYIDCISQDRQHQVINNSVILPIILQDAQYNLTYTTATSGIIAGTDYVQTFLLSGRAIYILFNMEAFYLYSVPATLTSQCLFAFITSDTGYLVTVCSNQDDTFFYYYNGTQSNNRTMMAFSSYQLTKTALPGLISAQFQYNVLSLTYKTFMILMNVTVTNVTMTVNNHVQFMYSYDILSTSLFVVNLQQLEKNGTRDDGIDVNAFMANMGAGVVFLYTNGVLQFQYYDQKNNSLSKYATYLTHLPNGIQITSVNAFSYGWVTDSYISVPFLIATNSVSYLFQVTLPIVEKGGSAQTYLIYTLIPYDRYKTVAVYVSGNAIAAIFYTDLDIDQGHREFVIGLYGVPTLKNYADDEQLKVQFDPDRVYQHAGTSIGFVGIQNLTNQTISNFVFTSNKTLIYQVNQTAFSYMYLNPKIRLTINQVQCINSSSIHHALNSTKIELIATNNLTKDFSRNSFIVENVYPSYTFSPLDIRRYFWWQFGVGVIMFSIIAAVITFLCCNSNKIIVYKEQYIDE